MTVLLQISDPHFGTERTPVAEALGVLCRRMQPDLLVLSGDITQRARRDQFRRARAWVDSLGAPVLAIPGNHDLPLFGMVERLRDPYARHREAFGDLLEPVHASAELLVIGVNTTRWYRHKNGEVCARQIERVAVQLAQAQPGQLRLVVAHHPIAVQTADESHNLMCGHANALRSWAAAGADLVMGGHIHLPYVMALPGLARPVWAVQAGTAISRRVRDGRPNSVNLLRWGTGATTGHCIIEQWDFEPLACSFKLSASTDVRPARALA
jgi:3',5'-cyclic AMP phosphodiesterase CpdA